MKPNPLWLDIGSVKNIKKVLSEKNRLIYDPFDLNSKDAKKLYSKSAKKRSKKNAFLKQQNSIKKLVPVKIEPEANMLSSRSGMAEKKFQKFNEICTDTQLHMRKILKNYSHSKKILRKKYFQCLKVANSAYEESSSIAISDEFFEFKNKLKLSRNFRAQKLCTNT